MSSVESFAEASREAGLRDTRGRVLRDLRISVTDRCNFRCAYCMPRDVFGPDYAYLPHREILSFEEITRVARLLVDLGVRKIRLTGGEPLLRRNVERLVEQLARLDIDDLSLTTNGALLARKAQTLKDAGLQRVTVSLDALDDPTFKRMNDADYPVGRILEGIEAAAAAGLGPVKINTVIQRGVNEHAILDLARHFRGSGHLIRFIEFMDVGSSNGWELSQVVPSREVIARIDAEFPVETLQPNYPGEVAQRWQYRDGAGEVGVISSVTQAFCGSCTRLRLSTDGQLYTCLFALNGFSLRPWLRPDQAGDQPADQAQDEAGIDAELRQRLRSLWQARSDRYSEIRTAETTRLHKIEMSYIGG